MAPAEAGIPPASGAVARIGELIRTRTRMQIRPRMLDSIVRVVERRASELDIDPDAYIEHVVLAHEATEIEHLISELTVGETHFFRGPPQFEALRRDVVPSLVHKKRATRTLSVLSAGCATGEEAYSLAIVLHECVPSPAWQIEVHGVDINARFLQKAEAARYSAWSLRDVPDMVRRRYFDPDGEMLVLREELRRLVQFRRFGLTDAPLTSIFPSGFDLVVCQNVLYYLERDARLDVVASLASALSPLGFLVLGPVDHSGDVPLCRAVHVGDVVVYERIDPAMNVERVESHVVKGKESSVAPVVLPPSLPPLEQKAPSSRATIAPAPTLENAVACADAGDLSGALRVLELVLDAEPEEPRAHLLMGLLMIELGRLEEALDAFRRCVYLDPAMMLALAGASVAGRRLGREDLAARYAARLRALGREKNVATPVEGWDGMTVGTLLRLFRDGNQKAPRASEGLSR